MMVALNVWPEQTYRFSTRKFLPPKKNRHFKSSEFIIPYKLIKSKTNLINKIDEIFAIGIGSSFDLNELKKINKPTFLLSFWNILKIDNKNNIIYSSEEGGYGHSKNLNNFESLKEYKNENLTYVTSEHKLIEKFKSRGHKVIAINTYVEDGNENYFPLTNMEKSPYLNMFDDERCKRISLIENILKPPVLPTYPHWSQTGSVLPFICALSFFQIKLMFTDGIFFWILLLTR